LPNNLVPRYTTIAVFIAILAVSTASLFIKFAQREAPSLAIAAVRLIISSLFLLPIAISRYKNEIFSIKRKDLFLASISGIFLAFHFATWIASLEYTSVASSVVLVSTGPIWVALFSFICMKESISRSLVLGMLIALAGGFLIAMSEACKWQGVIVCPSSSTFFQTKSVFGDILAFLGAVMVSGYLLIGRQLRTRIPLIPYIFIVYCIAAVVLIILMLSAGQSPFGYSFETYIWLILLALIPQIIGHSTYNWSLRFLPASTVAVATLGEPIGATILAYFLLNETPSGIKIAGAIIILAGIYITISKQRNIN